MSITICQYGQVRINTGKQVQTTYRLKTRFSSEVYLLYESVALPTELRRQKRIRILSFSAVKCQFLILGIYETKHNLNPIILFLSLINEYCVPIS